MSTSGGVFTWISAKNPMQIKWAIRYILRNGSNYTHLSSYADIKSFGESITDNSDNREFIRRMKAAWNQKQFRDRSNGKISCNFSLKISTKNALNDLANRQNISVTECLDQLILNTFNQHTNSNAIPMPGHRSKHNTPVSIFFGEKHIGEQPPQPLLSSLVEKVIPNTIQPPSEKSNIQSSKIDAFKSEMASKLSEMSIFSKQN